MTDSTPLKARPTTYKGIKMRSRLEAGFAAWLDSVDISWEYEPGCFADETGQYLPDFRLDGVPVNNGCPTALYVEIKPADPELDVMGAWRRMMPIRSTDKSAVLAVMGPHDLLFWAFPVLIGSKWDIGVWSRCIGGCGSLAIAVREPWVVEQEKRACPVCQAWNCDIESPWAGKPYWTGGA